MASQYVGLPLTPMNNLHCRLIHAGRAISYQLRLPDLCPLNFLRANRVTLDIDNDLLWKSGLKMKNTFSVLIVEDDHISRRMLAKALTTEGHRVVSVENGRKALDSYKNEFFQIVLTDWNMPEMNGLELCQAIRERHSSSYVFIILLTSRDSKQDIIAGLEAGADDYLTKPFDPTELIARLNTGIRILELERSLNQALEEIEILSVTDPLTEVYNRRYLNENFAREIKRAVRYQRPLAAVICDIDNFKKINDTYGHLAGDEVLKIIAQHLKDAIRGQLDWVVRYGGEEFVIVAPETGIEGARLMTERIRVAIENKIIKVDKSKIRITVSFGVTGIDADTHSSRISPIAILNQMDRYLYQAKEEGRNRVIVGPMK